MPGTGDRTKKLFLIMSQCHTPNTDKGWGGTLLGKVREAVKAETKRWIRSVSSAQY